MPNLLNITFKSNCNLPKGTNMTITGLTRTQTNSSIINISSSSSRFNASYAYTERSSSLDPNEFQCAQLSVRSGRESQNDVIDRNAAWNQASGTLVLTVGALGVDVNRVYETSFMVVQPANNTDFPRKLTFSAIVEAGEFDSPSPISNMSQGKNEHLGIHLGTMPLFTKLPQVDELIVSQHYPLPGLLNVFNVRLAFDIPLLRRSTITITGMNGMHYTP
jgi:hypothetical protein